MSNASAGWQPDPSGRHELRYWDGSTWTQQVADGGESSTDPIGVSGEQPAAVSSGPSTGLLVGLGIVVLGLAAAIGVVLMTDDGGGGGGDDINTTSDTQATDTSAPSTTTTSLMTTTTVAEPDAPAGMESVVDGIITDFQGEVDEDDARCMVREAGNEGIRREIDTTTPFDSLPTEDQTAIMFAMLDNCVDIDQVMANLMATGMVQEGSVTQAQADCASVAIVEAVGSEALLEAIANAGQAGDPLQELSTDDQVAVNDAILGCI